MLGTPSPSAEAAAAIPEAPVDSGGSAEAGGGGAAVAGGGGISSGFSEDEKGRIEDGERIGGGNRWPRQETLSLLKIRSEMDVAFRDSSLKGPLWNEVSRKMAELGYHRTPKKCKEKFENVFKYHKRTKEGRASKSDGKTYRFFDQLEALEGNIPPSLQLPPPPRPHQPPIPAAAATAAPMQPSSNPPIIVSSSAAPLSPNPVSFAQNFVAPNVSNNAIPTPQQPLPQAASSMMNATNIPHRHPSNTLSPLPNLSVSMLSISSSSSTSSDEDIGRRHSRKRKWKDFFERLVKNVIDRQEDLQKKLLDALEKRERDRMIREDAWRVQEMARMNREHDLLVQERSMAAAKDSAVIAFLQKVTEQQNQQNPTNNSNGTNGGIRLPVELQLPKTPLPPPPPPPPVAVPAPPSISVAIPQELATPTAQIQAPASSAPPPPPTTTTTRRQMEIITTPNKTDNGIQNFSQPSSSRWPKSEVEALITLRTNLDIKYQENGPKGPLWEEISSEMRKLGYNRNAKRCKEKWENINKYFKKVKESNKKRPEESKTCPYFHQLDALYREKAKGGDISTSFLKPENPMLPPIMATPEQQWPIQQEQQRQLQCSEEDHESDNMDDDDDDEEDDEGSGRYEIVPNNKQS